MIPSSSCPPWPPDQTGCCRSPAETDQSYTIPWGTIGRFMRVQRKVDGRACLLDSSGNEIAAVSKFVTGLLARGSSPNTVASYVYDLRRLYDFLESRSLTPDALTVAGGLEFLVYLRSLKARRGATPLADGTINRILAASSSFYTYLLLAEWTGVSGNPFQVASAGPRHSHWARGRGWMRLPRPRRLPRPLSEEQVTQLLTTCTCRRDMALLLLMLQGGLRIGEVLNLHLEDVQYGHRRIIVRYRCDHPKGVRTKSRAERVVDLLEPETLSALSAYITHERPRTGSSQHIFVAGGGSTVGQPLGYAAVAKWFSRKRRSAGLTGSSSTIHSLRHTHATRMWEAGMSELSLQRRLGHASFESTRMYTEITDEAMLADYRKALGL